jgi:hypothetical protein
VVVGLFVAVTGLAMVTGHWHSRLGPREYLQLIPAANAAGQP